MDKLPEIRKVLIDEARKVDVPFGLTADDEAASERVADLAVLAMQHCELLIDGAIHWHQERPG